jgi:hypothetical protein
MKTIITFSLIALSLFSLAQPTVYVWRATPDTVCAGDSIKIDYKSIWPNQPDNTTSYFFLSPGPTMTWSGNWSILKARPKEHYPALVTGDSTNWIKVKVPLTVAAGSYTVHSNTNLTGMPVIYVKDCAPIITGIETYSPDTVIPVYFDLQGNRIEKQYNTLMIEQKGYLRRKIYISK